VEVFLGLLFEKPDTCEALVVSVRKTEGGPTDYQIKIIKPRHSLVLIRENEVRILARQVRLEIDGCIY